MHVQCKMYPDVTINFLQRDDSCIIRQTSEWSYISYSYLDKCAWDISFSEAIFIRLLRVCPDKWIIVIYHTHSSSRSAIVHFMPTSSTPILHQYPQHSYKCLPRPSYINVCHTHTILMPATPIPYQCLPHPFYVSVCPTIIYINILPYPFHANVLIWNGCGRHDLCNGRHWPCIHCLKSIRLQCWPVTPCHDVPKEHGEI